jgi:hypothetical protein
MNIDNPLSESDLNNKLKKINKLTTSMGNATSVKTLVTKGLLDTYRIIIESTTIGRIPVVIAFKQCTASLLQLLYDYSNKKRIILKI